MTKVTISHAEEAHLLRHGQEIAGDRTRTGQPARSERLRKAKAYRTGHKKPIGKIPFSHLKRRGSRRFWAPRDEPEERPQSGREQAVARDPFRPNARARAILRGKRISANDLEAAGGTYSIDEVRELLNGVSRQAVAQRVSDKALLAVDGPNNRRRYPTFQFNEDGTVLSGLRDVLQAFPSQNPWAALDFLNRPSSSLDGRTPVDVLREGSASLVVSAARRYGEHGG